MKKGFFYSMLIILGFSLMSSMCSSDDDNNPNDNTAEIQQINTAVQTGTWRVTNYIDSGQNETNDFNGYDFTFGSGGLLTATNGTTTYTGSWSVTNSSNSNDDSSNSNSDIDFNIFFSVPDTDNFEDLNDDWEIVTHNSNTISLIDISGGNGGTDTLVFQKN